MVTVIEPVYRERTPGLKNMRLPAPSQSQAGSAWRLGPGRLSPEPTLEKVVQTQAKQVCSSWAGIWKVGDT